MPKPKVLLCLSGSVAAIKAGELAEKLCEFAECRIVATKSAVHFMADVDFGDIAVLTEADEWNWRCRADPVLHIELRRWADIGLIAPLSANSLGKIANGLCDNLLTCVVRAWDLEKPLVFAPAMNVHMWHHPVTAQHLDKLNSWGFIELPTVKKTLICGDHGFGAMCPVDTIVEKIKEISATLN